LNKYLKHKIQMINCKGTLLDFSTPKVMGIINYTPDSFYDGGAYKGIHEVLLKVEQMLIDGVALLDIGAYSSKPNAVEVSEIEEITRIQPVIKAIVSAFPNVILSVDTFRASVAKIAIHEGASIINDISAGNLDENMLETVASLQVPYCLMHMRGTPQTMQQHTNYQDITKEIVYYFSEKIRLARSFGINDLIIDPGFGFAKTIEQNFELLHKLDHFSILDLPLLAGISRKSMIYKTLHTTPEFALNGTTVLNTIALQKGAKILRVHDVKEAVECIKLFSKLNENH